MYTIDVCVLKKKQNTDIILLCINVWIFYDGAVIALRLNNRLFARAISAPRLFAARFLLMALYESLNHASPRAQIDSLYTPARHLFPGSCNELARALSLSLLGISPSEYLLQCHFPDHVEISFPKSDNSSLISIYATINYEFVRCDAHAIYHFRSLPLSSTWITIQPTLCGAESINIAFGRTLCPPLSPPPSTLFLSISFCFSFWILTSYN